MREGDSEQPMHADMIVAADGHIARARDTMVDTHSHSDSVVGMIVAADGQMTRVTDTDFATPSSSFVAGSGGELKVNVAHHGAASATANLGQSDATHPSEPLLPLATPATATVLAAREAAASWGVQPLQVADAAAAAVPAILVAPAPQAPVAPAPAPEVASTDSDIVAPLFIGFACIVVFLMFAVPCVAYMFPSEPDADARISTISGTSRDGGAAVSSNSPAKWMSKFKFLGGATFVTEDQGFAETRSDSKKRDSSTSSGSSSVDHVPDDHLPAVLRAPRSRTSTSS